MLLVGFRPDGLMKLRNEDTSDVFASGWTRGFSHEQDF